MTLVRIMNTDAAGGLPDRRHRGDRRAQVAQTPGSTVLIEGMENEDPPSGSQSYRALKQITGRTWGTDPRTGGRTSSPSSPRRTSRRSRASRLPPGRPRPPHLPPRPQSVGDRAERGSEHSPSFALEPSQPRRRRTARMSIAFLMFVGIGPSHAETCRTDPPSWIRCRGRRRPNRERTACVGQGSFGLDRLAIASTSLRFAGRKWIATRWS